MANTQMQSDFTRDPSQKLPPKGAKPRVEKVRKPIPRGKRPKAVSDRQAARTAFLHGIRAERIREQLATYGKAFCDSPDCFEGGASFEVAWATLDLHHTIKRSHGKGYKDSTDFGVDDPSLLVLVCRSCHRKLEKSEPQWGKAS